MLDFALLGLTCDGLGQEKTWTCNLSSQPYRRVMSDNDRTGAPFHPIPSHPIPHHTPAMQTTACQRVSQYLGHHHHHQYDHMYLSTTTKLRGKPSVDPPPSSTAKTNKRTADDTENRLFFPKLSTTAHHHHYHHHHHPSTTQPNPTQKPKACRRIPRLPDMYVHAPSSHILLYPAHFCVVSSC